MIALLMIIRRILKVKVVQRVPHHKNKNKKKKKRLTTATPSTWVQLQACYIILN